MGSLVPSPPSIIISVVEHSKEEPSCRDYGFASDALTQFYLLTNVSIKKLTFQPTFTAGYLCIHHKWHNGTSTLGHSLLCTLKNGIGDQPMGNSGIGGSSQWSRYDKVEWSVHSLHSAVSRPEFSLSVAR